jgi:transposase
MSTAYVDSTAQRIQAVLRAQQLAQPPQLVAAYAAIVRATGAVITTFTAEIAALQRQVEAHFGQHPDAEIYRSQPASVTFSAPGCWASSATIHSTRARKYAGTSPITRAGGKRRSCWPATSATIDWVMRCTSRRSPH